MTLIILGVFSAVALLASAIPFCRAEAWWVRVFDFPRLQSATAAAILLAADLLLLDLDGAIGWSATGAALAAFCIQTWWILPYTPVWRKEVPPLSKPDAAEKITLMAANVLQTNKHSDRFLKIVDDAEPDLLVAVETDSWWQARLDTLEARYPHTLKCPLDNLYGMLVYSKLPLENAKIQFLVEEDVPSMHALVRLPSGRGIRIHFVHPAPPSPTENDESSERDAELLVVGRSVAKAGVPVVVAGDLNDVAWSATTRLFRKASGLRDPRIGRGMFNTFHAGYWFLRWPLDHLFCSAHFQLEEIHRLPAFGSDHFPMLMKLACLPQKEDKSEALEADEDDEEWIDEKIQDEAVKPSDVHRPER